MKVIIDIPKNFERDYTADKFKDFFLRIIANINYKGVCGRYEKEIAEMFLKAFGDSEERNNKPCCRCDSKTTNADRIRDMGDEELADILFDSCIDHIEVSSCERMFEKDSCKECVLNWLQSEVE